MSQSYSLLDQSHPLSATVGFREPPSCQGAVFYEGDGKYVVKGMTRSFGSSAKLLFWAANPASRGYSCAGSGLPYPSAEMAFEDTPNRGVVHINNGYFEFRVHFPNAFYASLGTRYVEPCVFVKVCEEGRESPIQSIVLGNGIPFRTIDHPKERYQKGVMFYHGRDALPHRSQEQILRDSAYPEKKNGVFDVPANFWGNAIPQ
jgi:hypothetical protein